MTPNAVCVNMWSRSEPYERAHSLLLSYGLLLQCLVIAVTVADLREGAVRAFTLDVRSVHIVSLFCVVLLRWLLEVQGDAQQWLVESLASASSCKGGITDDPQVYGAS